MLTVYQSPSTAEHNPTWCCPDPSLEVTKYILNLHQNADLTQLHTWKGYLPSATGVPLTILSCCSCNSPVTNTTCKQGGMETKTMRTHLSLPVDLIYWPQADLPLTTSKILVISIYWLTRDKLLHLPQVTIQPNNRSSRPMCFGKPYLPVDYKQSELIIFESCWKIIPANTQTGRKTYYIWRKTTWLLIVCCAVTKTLPDLIIGH